MQYDTKAQWKPQWIRCLGGLGLLALLMALNCPSAHGDTPQNSARQASMQVLQHLRAGELAEALKQLGGVADLAAQAKLDNGVAAAAGGVYRSLSQLSDAEQYDLLHQWLMPTEDRQSVRLLTTLVPQGAPPEAFARELGERPRETSFPIAAVGPVRGLFSSGWLLVRTAHEVGRLRTLTAELQQLAADKVPNADTLLLLAKLADPRANAAELEKQLETHATALEQSAANVTVSKATVDPDVTVLAAAATTHPQLQPIAVRILNAQGQQANNGADPRWRAFLHVAHATLVQLHRGESAPETMLQNRLKYWVPASNAIWQSGAGRSDAAGVLDSVWLVHEDHVLHLAGPGDDLLLCQFPLTGEFELECESQFGGQMGTAGALTYGGLRFHAMLDNYKLTVLGSGLTEKTQQPCPFVVPDKAPKFHHVAVRSASEQTVMAVKRHPLWTQPSQNGQTSPWIGLHSFGDRRPIFRNVKISGQPVIPKEVRLTQGNLLRGWYAGRYGESTSPQLTEKPAAEEDWFLRDGVLQASARPLNGGADRQSCLEYERPLLEGESIAYQFFYQPGVEEVHPALGRLAFLLEPGGVRVHWMTACEVEWTGLKSDNALQEPFNRRGPRPLPLKENDWNAVEFSLRDDKVTVRLNGTDVYVRKLDYTGERAFGFYRDRGMAVKVRDVILTGDWPETLPADFLSNPVVTSGDTPMAGDQPKMTSVFPEEVLATNVTPVRRQAAALPIEQRLEFLADWVLPGKGHADFRLAGDFTPTDPSPPVLQMLPFADANSNGAEIVAPALDLLDAAAAAGKLAELRDRILALPPLDDELQQRAKAALLALVELELGDTDSAVAAVSELLNLVKAKKPAGMYDMWPETLVVYRASQRFPKSEAVGDLLLYLFEHRTMRDTPPGVSAWHTQIASLAGEYTHRLGNPEQAASTAGQGLENWIPVVRTRARSRGEGAAHARWRPNSDNEIQHVSGHQEEYLFYRSPLRGDYEIEFEMTASGTTQFLVGGMFFGPGGDLTKLGVGTFRDGQEAIDLNPPFAKLERWVRCRAAFHKGVCTVYINGRKVHEQKLPLHYDPWVGFRGWWRHAACFRDVRITGNPIVPNAVVLSASEDLTGWLPYHEESAGAKPGSLWKRYDDPESTGEIRRNRDTALTGAYFESLLRYQRPLAEDGSVEYDFYYQPGMAETNPALDRLAFMLAPDGVSIHWITDTPFDSTGLPPGNLTTEPENRRGPSALPLKANAWNHMKVALAADTVTLQLNSEMVYERKLEPGNRRTFGLFHYADTQVRVRNVVLRGDWPRAVPDVSEQALANATVHRLDADLPKLKAVFQHNFIDNGIPNQYFSIDAGTGSTLRLAPEGLLIWRPGIGRWASSQINLKLAPHGDFDIEAPFAQFESECDKDACAMLTAHLDDEAQTMFRVTRLDGGGRWPLLHSSVSFMRPDGNRIYSTTSSTSTEATSGRFRLARRGNVVYYLFSENDSKSYRLLHTDVLSDKPVVHGKLALQILCNGTGHVQVAWKELTVRAERLTYIPEANLAQLRAVYVMDADGNNLQKLTSPPNELKFIGSPEWSADGKQIVFDASSGPISTSYVFSINADGSSLRDLGPGCMPSLSPDGKQIVLSQSGQGVVLMNADGTGREVLDLAGWGVQWSPNGKFIAYGKGGNVIIHEVATGNKQPLLVGDQATMFGYIYWNLGWSHDSRSIAFKARNAKTGGDDVAVADIDSANGFKVLLSNAKGLVNPDLTFHPDNRQVVLCMNVPNQSMPRIVSIHRDRGEPPQVLDQQPTDHKISNCDWSHDGKRIAFTSELFVPPVPVDWSPVQAATR